MKNDRAIEAFRNSIKNSKETDDIKKDREVLSKVRRITCTKGSPVLKGKGVSLGRGDFTIF